ncbi:uncharacterized protein LOC112500576 isoform X2 [Cynara cardunculus var. scolymus]|uniref:uncharacterized protein LOC112500576 isoform X2 n=1 Tax=Cynara cardunculus var. scolymus TaxID=59895 RepID=UPI000D626C70|nr:uncharacterized protein LOC112500576 isoform X2 [Cynara cardunculus var. scolymus]
MEIPKGQNVVNSGGRSVVYELPLGEAAATFNLHKAVCSHGFFMTAPNHWDPLSKTLRRPLRLLDSSSSSVTVQISQPPHSSHLLLRVFDTESLSLGHQQSLMEQVRRMLRLSEEEEKTVREFQEIYGEAKESGFGRIFRSPTLFEDMVKCILVCNCQWSRTLSMARALCELQLELQRPMVTEDDKCTSRTIMKTQFSPKTPAGKEAIKRKSKSQEKSRKVAKRCAEVKSAMEADATLMVETDKESNQKRDSCVKTLEAIFPDFVDEKPKLGDHSGIGNFPSPKELANLDVNFLKKRGNLGYRANRILDLAQSVVEGTIQLGQLEQDSSLSNYINLNEQLGKINGFGPFTCANVLMCMGFYHVIPSDSETIRHLNQVHGKKSTIKSIQHDIEMIYTKSEIWSFYEERFGKLSELPNSDYKLITAANMRGKAGIR